MCMFYTFTDGIDDINGQLQLPPFSVFNWNNHWIGNTLYHKQLELQRSSVVYSSSFPLTPMISPHYPYHFHPQLTNSPYIPYSQTDNITFHPLSRGREVNVEGLTDFNS